MRRSPTGAELHWREAGSGDYVLLLVHGFPFDSRLWSRELAEPPAGWRVIAPDLRGFGESALGDEPVHTMELFARDLLGLLDRLDIRDAVVGGLSMGGYIALALWGLAPDRLRGLALIDTRAAADNEEGRRNRAAVAARVRAEGSVAGLVDDLLPRLLARRTLSERPALVARLREMMLGSSVEGVARASLGMAERADFTPRLAEIGVPALVAVGEEDALMPPEMSRAMAAELPRSRLLLIPDAGHVSSLEAPGELSIGIGRLLEDVVAAESRG